MSMKISFAERIGGSSFGINDETFKFEKIKQAKRKAQELKPGIFLIDMGVGEPDLPAASAVAKVLGQEAEKAINRFYADNGIMEYKRAVADYMKKFYDVNGLSLDNQICHGIGSKSILAILPLAFINPGDVAILTVPGYPILGTTTKYLGGQVYECQLHKKNGFLPNLSEIPEAICQRAKLLYLNYPNNPTGAVANQEFYEKVVAFAKKHQIVVVNDAAYGAILYDERHPFSFLSVPGAMEVGVEIHSMSKAFCMTGWRLGFIVGNEKVVKAFATVKNNMDSGQFRAIQLAGAYALKNPELTKVQVRRYEVRMRALVDTLNKVGFSAEMAAGTYYLYVKAPVSGKRADGIRVQFNHAEDAATFLIEEALISTVPWTEAGDYLRWSVTYETGEYSDQEVMELLKRRLEQLELTF